jgi:hypothetical protein
MNIKILADRILKIFKIDKEIDLSDPLNLTNVR